MSETIEEKIRAKLAQQIQIKVNDDSTSDALRKKVSERLEREKEERKKKLEEFKLQRDIERL